MSTTGEFIISKDSRVLVTGANGFIGARVAQTLLSYGFTSVRCLVRSTSRLGGLQDLAQGNGSGKHIEIVIGDLVSRDDCARAAEGVSVIYHLAAGFDKSFAGAFMNSALATRNLIEAFLERGEPKRFVNVSSFAVYSTLNLPPDSILDESSPLEDAPQERADAYGFGKLKQEQIVRDYGNRGLPFVILRPGAVFGPGKRDLSGRVGIETFGRFIQVGGGNLIPLTYVDNCAEAIMLAGLRPGIDGEVFNVVDDELITGKQLLERYKQRRKSFRSVRIPYSLGYALSVCWEKYADWSKGQLPRAFNRRRCTAEWKPMRYSNRKLKERLGWSPRIPMEQGIALYLQQFEGN